MPLLDFDTLVISDNAYVLHSSYEPCNIESILQFFCNLGIRHFYVQHTADPAESSASNICASFDALKSELSHIKPRSAYVTAVQNVHVSPSVMRNPLLNKLCVPHSDKLFIQTLPFVDASWLDADLNYLIFKQNLRPIFSSFEKLLLTSEPSFTARLFKSKNLAFCIDINYLFNPSFSAIIQNAISKDVTVIPCISNQLYAYSGVTERVELSRCQLGRDTYLKFCRQINNSCKRTFSR